MKKHGSLLRHLHKV